MSVDAALEWLKRAQDAADGGGIAARYSAYHGTWDDPYPETTGYIIPTLQRLGEEERAQRAADYLESVQYRDGGIPAGQGTREELAHQEPALFNTAQVMHGLYSAGREDAGHRAADWIVRRLEPDGGFSDCVYGRVPPYTAFVADKLALWGFEVVARRHLHYLIGLQQANGWYRHTPGLSHFVGYTLQGMTNLAETLDDECALESAYCAATQLLRHGMAGDAVPAIILPDWSGASAYVCVTGCAQIAEVFLKLYRLVGTDDSDFRFVDAARRLLKFVESTQAEDGGVPGSHPLSGPYDSHSYPNWAAKFYIDAMLELPNG